MIKELLLATIVSTSLSVRTPNDVEKKLVRTNYILRGIEVDKGENTIEMVFNPNSYIIGDKIIKASNYILLLLIIICCIIEFRKKNDK